MTRGTAWLISQAKEEAANIIAIEKLNTNSMSCTEKQKAVFKGLLTSIPTWAKRNNLQVVTVNPPYTSMRCYNCGSLNTLREDRNFLCYGCGYDENADVNAAKIIGLMGIIDLIIKDKSHKTNWKDKYFLATSRLPMSIEKIEWAYNYVNR
jgi:transposase